MYKHIRHKFNAVRCEADGIKFPSKLERNIYIGLKEYQAKGDVILFLRQVGFDLDFGRHQVDFQVFLKHESFFLEAKGRDLTPGKMKRLGVERRYNIPIHVVKSVKDLHALMKEKLAEGFED